MRSEHSRITPCQLHKHLAAHVGCYCCSRRLTAGVSVELVLRQCRGEGKKE